MTFHWDEMPLTNAGSKGAAKHGAFAYFPGTGPTGATCRGCRLLKIKDREAGSRGICSKHAAMMRCKGIKIPAGTAACKYYEAAQ